MPYTSFYTFFPEIAKNETRSFFSFNNSDLPEDQYALFELYCDEPGCDCRRVIFNIVSEKHKKTVAVIAFGWENRNFYKQWFGKDDPEVINELQGPILNLASPQSKIAPVLLVIVTNILKDKNYIKRLKYHYKIFRDYIENHEHTNQL